MCFSHSAELVGAQVLSDSKHGKINRAFNNAIPFEIHTPIGVHVLAGTQEEASHWVMSLQAIIQAQEVFPN